MELGSKKSNMVFDQISNPQSGPETISQSGQNEESGPHENDGDEGLEFCESPG